ncbi:MAG: hypothetical protein ACRD1S_19095 [Vicinamibacterales bacterium]
MQDWARVWPIVALVLAVAAVVALTVWSKGRPLDRDGRVFRASRLSHGNHLFPTQVIISPASVLHYTPQWIGKLEHSIHLAHVASVRIDTNLLFADVFIETSGGASPVKCRGHRKGDAVAMKGLIEKYQTEYYRGLPNRG